MTKQEAIQILKRFQEPEPWEPHITVDAYDALQMAIDALGSDNNVRGKGDMISRAAAQTALMEKRNDIL